ncbi:ABC transporter substrate-binding protein [Tistrella mobilis]|uniref:ABC transporter substrate-binding protein n=1 Tax=Tistrella mobilis TaxID=171437 RepID=UPI0035566FD8
MRARRLPHRLTGLLSTRFLSIGLLLTGLVLAAPPSASAGDGPRRIVSMNLCADELLLRLAPPGRLVSVTWLAAGPAAIDPAAAQGLVLNHGRAEEIARLAPDLVVAGRYTTLTTTQMLRRAGIPVLLLDEATSLAGIRSQVTSLAAAVGNPAAGRKMLDAMDRMLGEATLDAKDTPLPGVVVLRPGGGVAGAGTLQDEILAAAGLRNLAPDAPVDGDGRIGLERLLRLKPDLLVLDSDGDAPPALAREVLDHPAFRARAAGMAITSLPAALWVCPGPWVAEAVGRLSAARRSLAARQRGSRS